MKLLQRIRQQRCYSSRSGEAVCMYILCFTLKRNEKQIDLETAEEGLESDGRSDGYSEESLRYIYMLY